MDKQPVTRVLVIEQGAGLWESQRFVLRMAPLLERRGVEQILATPPGSPAAAAWQAAGREHATLPGPLSRTLRHPDRPRDRALTARETGRTVATAARAAQLARRLDVDVLQANSHWSHLAAVLAAAACRRPALLVLHEENDPDLVGRLRGAVVRAAAGSVAVSDAVASSLPPWAAGRTVVVRSGVDTDRLRPGPVDPAVRASLSTDPTAPLVLVVSRLDQRSGINAVIRAVAALPQHLASTRLAVAGAPSTDPSSPTSPRRLGAELLDGRVVFLGPRTDVGDLLRASDVLVLTSSLEGLPRCVLEAQACGRPVVCFPSTGVPEIVTDQATGLIARPDDIADLSDKIAQVLDNGTLADLLRARARANVVAQHTLAAQADSLTGILVGLTSQAGFRHRRPRGHSRASAPRRQNRHQPAAGLQ
ncbi:glycosyl transferase family 1 [Frankia sp. CcI49]|uniref:glycosyltransferase family 4 protein n=1 Tax=unclassified Frankia TaxID=2632575 RepID=UPI0006CA4FFA|nr:MULTISPECIES: glycosyltransferase family 4 protein [unclassified Frankia]KPM57451.1 glycosyl transferase family 1 [Frankia sp. R43]ONH57925.1 glycosyl transferase family 1 [Frankia sp. CcI49]